MFGLGRECWVDGTNDKRKDLQKARVVADHCRHGFVVTRAGAAKIFGVVRVLGVLVADEGPEGQGGLEICKHLVDKTQQELAAPWRDWVALALADEEDVHKNYADDRDQNANKNSW